MGNEAEEAIVRRWKEEGGEMGVRGPMEMGREGGDGMEKRKKRRRMIEAGPQWEGMVGAWGAGGEDEVEVVDVDVMRQSEREARMRGREDEIVDGIVAREVDEQDEAERTREAERLGKGRKRKGVGLMR